MLKIFIIIIICIAIIIYITKPPVVMKALGLAQNSGEVPIQNLIPIQNSEVPILTQNPITTQNPVPNPTQNSEVPILTQNPVPNPTQNSEVPILTQNPTTTQNPVPNPTQNPVQNPVPNPTQNSEVPILTQNPTTTQNPVPNPVPNPTQNPVQNPVPNPTQNSEVPVPIQNPTTIPNPVSNPVPNPTQNSEVPVPIQNPTTIQNPVPEQILTQSSEPIPSECSDNIVYGTCKDMYGLDILDTDCSGNTSGLIKGVKTITYNDISPEIKCPEPTKIACDFKCPVNCVGDWKNVGTCKIDRCNNTKGEGQQTQEYDVITPSKNGGKACLGPTREVPCSEDNYIGCVQCGGKNGSRILGATCDNIKSCEDLIGVGERTDKWYASNYNVLPGCIMPPDMKIPCRTDGKWSDCNCSYDISSNSFCNETNTVCKGNRSECTVNYTKRESLPQQNGAPGICTLPTPKHYNVNLDKCECTVERDIGEWIYTNQRCDPNNRTTFIANKRSRLITIKKTRGNIACLITKLSDNESLLDTPENKIKGIMNSDGSLQFGANNDFNGATFQTIETENNINFPDNINCKCEGTYDNWTNWSNWTNDTICPSASDYSIEESAFNITQSRTGNRTFKISNLSSLLTNYSCPQQEKINTQKKETRNYTCPRNCYGVWSEWTKCNGTCPDNPVTNSGSLTKNFTEGQTKQTTTYTIKKTPLGSGDVCTIQNECDNIVYGPCKDIYGLDIDCIKNSTKNPSGLEKGVKTITFNDTPGKKCPNSIRSACNIKCPVNCVGNWENVGTCKIKTCNNKRGEGTQTQFYDVKTPAQNGGDPCLGPTREVACYEDNHIGCTQCGGSNAKRALGATCDNIKSCEDLIGVGERIDKWSVSSFNSLPGCIMPADIKVPCKTAGKMSDCVCSYDISSNSFCNETNTVCTGSGSVCTVNYTKREPLPQPNGAPGICTEPIPKHYNVNLNLCECTVERNIGEWIYTNPRCDPNNRRTFIADKRSRPITIKKIRGNIACSFNKLSDNESLLDTPENKIKGIMNSDGSFQFGANNDFNEATFQTVETENYINYPDNINCICEGTHDNWTNWSNWTNDTICPSANDYSVEDSAFNITQSRTGNRTFRISNSNSLYTNYSCPQQENINTKVKETRNYTCPRDCLGIWSEWKTCDTTCPDNPVTNSGTWIKNFTEGQTKQTATYTIKKTKLGTGNACTIQNDCSENIVYGPCKDMYGLDIDIDPQKKTTNPNGLEKGVKTITFNDVPGKKCPNPILIGCNIKRKFDCVHNGWQNVGTCKINTCNNKRGEGKQTQFFDKIHPAQNGGDPCLGPTREVACYEDNHIGCTQCGGSNAKRALGATCDNIKSCEDLIGVGERIDKWSANSLNSLPGCIMPADIKVPCRTAGKMSNCACSYDISSNSFCNETNTVCSGSGSVCTVNYTKREPLPQPNGAPGICTEPIPKHYNVNLNLCECRVERIIGDWIYTNPRCDPNNRTTFIATKRSRPITIKKVGGNKACLITKLSDNESLLDTPDNKTKGIMNGDGSLQFTANNDNKGNTFQTVETEDNINFADNINCKCEGTYDNWTDWSNWTNDTICPSATDYNVEDSAFNITQSRTSNRTFKISNSSSLYTNYSCFQQEKNNTQKKETRNYTCPRNCLGVWSEWTKCNGTCPNNPATNSGTLIKNFTEGETKQTATYTIKKTKLGTGDVCTIQSDCNNIVNGTCKDIYGLDIDCIKNSTKNRSGLEKGVKTITFNDVPGKKCPNPIRIACNIKCPVNCVNNGWQNLGTCKINSCNNKRGEGKQTQFFDKIHPAQNGGDPCLGPTREVACYEDNHIGCTQCGGKNAGYVPGATCENIRSCEDLTGVGERIDKWSATSLNSLPGCIMPADMKVPCRTAGKFSNCVCSYDISSNSFCNETNTVCSGTGSTCTVSYTKKEPLPQKNGAPGICTEPIPTHKNVNLDKCECTVERNIGEWIYTNPRCDPNNRTTFLADKRSRPITIKRLGGNLACSFNKLSDNESLLDTPENKTRGILNPNGSWQFRGIFDKNGETFQTVETENDIIFEDNINCKCEGTYGPMSWTNWTNDRNCPTATDYNKDDSAFNITQTRTGRRTFTITNLNILKSNYSCPQKEDIKETQIFTCPRDCSGNWSEWSECDSACSIGPLDNSGTWTKTSNGDQAIQTAKFIINKTRLGTGVSCPETKSQDCNTSRRCTYYPTLVESSCPANYSHANDDYFNAIRTKCYENCTGSYYNYGINCKSIPDAYHRVLTKIRATVSDFCPIGYNTNNNDGQRSYGKCRKDCDSGYTYNNTDKTCIPN